MGVCLIWCSAMLGERCHGMCSRAAAALIDPLGEIKERLGALESGTVDDVA